MAIREVKYQLPTAEELVSLLRHAVRRNHEHSPCACSPCEDIENLLTVYESGALSAQEGE